ncbi:hypothetical protein [Pseudomonas sp. SCB32]|uniref:hypothetical protein n=1 Tax=Pseudomonas sp. SCB32 TaxID=2653853 RepID=UPI0012656CE7|nr:hypothetical protein [Pseudomonas sp. SCB32]
MIKPILFFVALAVLAGCDNEAKSPSKEQAGSASVAKPTETAVAAKQLQLPDGSVLPLSGNILKQTSKPNDNGALSISEVEFDSSSRKAEEAVSTALEKSGYSRRVVVEEREGFLKVHYYKSNSPVVGGIYKDQEKEADGQERSLMRLYWQES